MNQATTILTCSGIRPAVDRSIQANGIPPGTDARRARCGAKPRGVPSAPLLLIESGSLLHAGRNTPGRMGGHCRHGGENRGCSRRAFAPCARAARCVLAYQNGARRWIRRRRQSRILSRCMGFACTDRGFLERRCFVTYPAGVEVGGTLTARVAFALCTRRIRFSISTMPRLTTAASTMNVQSDSPIGAVRKIALANG